MTGTLATLRTELATTLTPLGLNTYTHIPGRMTLPGAFVMAGAPYIEQAQTFGARTVRFGVLLATQTGANDAETDVLDGYIEAAQKALEHDGWLVEEVSQPAEMSFNNTNGLVVEITVTATVTFT